MNTKIFILCFSGLLLVSGGCRSISKMLDQGRYDEALTHAQKKMAGKKDRKHKYVIAVEDAFAKVTARDMERIERLRRSGRSEDWQQIVSIADRIDRRQRALQPYLPLISDNGYQAKFNFVRTEEIAQHAEDQLITELYEEGARLMGNARLGDKRAAQMAYDRYTKLLQRSPTYSDAGRLRDEARQLGIVQVLATVDNRAHRYMPGFVAEALQENLTIQNTFWVQYHTHATDQTVMDYEVRMVVSEIEVGPDAVREEKLDRRKKIEDGWEYVLDRNGNVAKDSLGNDLKKPKVIEVAAYVVLVHQEKAAFLRGRLELVEMKTGAVIETRPVGVESRFYHKAQSFFGDERALDKKDKVYIGIVPFPPGETMMLEVARLLHPAFRTEMQQFRSLLQYL